MKKIRLEAVQKTYPETKRTKNTEGLEQLFEGAEKCPFIIQYIPFTKGIVVSELNRIGCRRIRQLDFANCVAVYLSKSQLKEISGLACVKTIEQDYDYQVLSNGMPNAKVAPHLEGGYRTNTGKEIKLAVFDTDVFYTLTADYVWFADEARDDEDGHGTLMAEIISTRLFDRKNFISNPHVYSAIVANYKGIAKTSSIMEALDWAIHNEIKIISMSFGGHHKSTLLEEMIGRAASNGIIMVAAAGNDGAAYPIQYPAAFANVLSVGAKKGDLIAAYSNGGENADCYASGMQNAIDLNGHHICVTGTSGATAFVAGTILKNWCIHPEMTAAEMIAKTKDRMAFSARENFSVQRREFVDENGIFAEKATVAFFRRVRC